MTCPRNRTPCSALSRALLVVALTCGPVGRGLADVVPPRAIEVAEGWLALVDAGRYREAVHDYLEPGDAHADAMLARLAALDAARRASTLRYRSIRSWRGHGRGDSSHMEPGGYFSLVFDAAYDSGVVATDEVRMVPRGDGDWRVVDYRRPVDPAQEP